MYQEGKTLPAEDIEIKIKKNYLEMQEKARKEKAKSNCTCTVS